MKRRKTIRERLVERLRWLWLAPCILIAGPVIGFVVSWFALYELAKEITDPFTEAR